jgi:hypothetical protein
MKARIATTGLAMIFVLASPIGFAAPIPVAPSKKMLNDALNPQTRQTLQQAMDSVDPASLVVPETSLTLGPGEAAEIDGTQASKIAFAKLPALVRSALSTGARRVLSDGASQ